MKPKISTLILLFFACLGPITGPGFGPPSYCQAMTQLTKLKVLSEVRAERRHVSLLDLCDPAGIPDDWKKTMSEVDIGESPAAGAEKVINPAQLKAFIESFLSTQSYDSSKVQIALPTSIRVTRLSVLVPKERIESIFKDYIAKNAPWNPRDVVIGPIYYPGNVELPAGDMTYEITANPQERFIGNVGITIQFIVGGEKDRSIRVTGKIELFQNVVHAIHVLKRNDIITEADVQLEKTNVSDSPDRFAGSIDQVVGKRVTRELAINQPIVLSELATPLAFKSGATVTIVYEQGALRVTAKGQTRQDGSIGSMVRVVNVMTNRMITCRVIDASTVQAVP